MSAKKEPSSRNAAQNRKARRDYFIEEEIEAGIVLTGTEVKSLRDGQANISDAHAGPREGELWLMGATINEFKGGNRHNHEPTRPRKLLLHKRQIEKLIGKTRTKGITLVPLAIYFNARGIAKVKLGLARGKKEYDKRDTIKKRDWEKQQRQLLKKKSAR
jgi:SsrA-binding protein